MVLVNYVLVDGLDYFMALIANKVFRKKSQEMS